MSGRYQEGFVQGCRKGLEDAEVEIERLLRCIASIEEELTRDPPRVGDALHVCEAARAR